MKRHSGNNVPYCIVHVARNTSSRQIRYTVDIENRRDMYEFVDGHTNVHGHKVDCIADVSYRTVMADTTPLNHNCNTLRSISHSDKAYKLNDIVQHSGAFHKPIYDLKQTVVINKCLILMSKNKTYYKLVDKYVAYLYNIRSNIYVVHNLIFYCIDVYIDT